MFKAIIIQSRYNSSRLPGKALADIAGKPMIEWVILRALTVRGVNGVLVTIPESDEEWYRPTMNSLSGARKLRWVLSNTPENNVLLRFEQTAVSVLAETIVRITGDCPLICPYEIERVLGIYNTRMRDKTEFFVTNDTAKSGFPDGCDVEVFNVSWLHTALHLPGNNLSSYDLEHVTPYIRRHAKEVLVRAPVKYPRVKLSVDSHADLQRVREIYRLLLARQRGRITDYSLEATFDAIKPGWKDD